MATAGALAAAPRFVRSSATPAPASQPPHPAVRPTPPPRQAALFPDRSNVLPFDGVFSPPPKSRTVTRTSARVQARRAPAANDSQTMLDFLAPAPPAPRRLSTTVEAVITCEAPVAAPMHRACAAAIDGSMIVIACGLFLTTFHFLGGPVSLSKPVLLVMGAAALLIALFYGFLWVCAGGRTLGMRCLKLTLINFEGYPPDATARWLRYLGACLGYCAGGLGLLWALLDEESLAWHDHISKTFPTFHGPETSFVRRR